MSSLLSLEKTVNQLIYEFTCLDVIKELSKNLAEDKPTKESFTSMNGIDKSVQEINFTEGINNLYKKYHNPNIVINNHGSSWGEWLDNIEILKIGNHDMSINEAMKIANNLFNDIGNQFYGMLLTTKGSKKKKNNFQSITSHYCN